MISFIINAIKIIFLLGFLILIHEAGHFLVAKLFKVKVNEFSLGFGKVLYSKQRKETRYCIRAFPLGGFVSMEGEDERSDENGSFSKLSIPKRILIVAAGATVNIVFGLLVFFALACSIGNFYSTTVAEVVDTYAADNVGIMPGDKILEINNKKIRLNSDITEEVEKSNGESINVLVLRDGKEISYDFKPTEKITKTIGIYLGNENTASCKIESIYENSPAEKVGLQSGDIIFSVNGEEVNKDYKRAIELIQNSEGNVKLTVDRNGEKVDFDIIPIENKEYYIGAMFKVADKNIKNNLYYGFWTTVDFSGSLLYNVKELFTGNVSTDQLMGPVGISSTVASTTTFAEFIYLLAVISLSLGVTNLLPIPALDGGKILLLLIEAIRRKPLSEKFEITVQLIGFSLLILLSIYVSYNDILRLF